MDDSEIIWREYHKRLRSFIVRRVDAMDADDIMQDVFVKIHQNMASLRAPEKLESWLYQVTRNTITDYYRTKKPVSDLPEWVADDDAMEQHENEIRAELANCLLPMIDKLPERYRSAVYLSEIQGEPQSAVASKEGISLSGAKSRIQRGRHSLREMLTRCCEIEINNKKQIVSYESKDGNCDAC